MSIVARHVGRTGISPSVALFRRAQALRAEGADVLVLCAGEPDFDTPAHICAAGMRAIEDGHTRYTAVDGIAELKQAVCEKFRRDNQLAYDPAQVIIGAGGKAVLFSALFASLDPGDEVIVPAPYWTSYPDMVRLCHGRPVVVPTDPAQGYRPDPARIEAAITPRSRWLLLNSPGNPSGAVLGEGDLAALAEVLRRHRQVGVISDDIYEHIVYPPARFATLAAVAPDLADRVLTVNGVSKTYAMTGWRIGYAAGPAELIDAMRVVQSQASGNPASISQWAAQAALQNPADFLPAALARFQARRDRVVEALGRLPGLACPLPDGAFYVFADIAGCIGRVTPAGRRIDDDEAFVMALLEEQGVALVHGGAYGTSPAIRMSYAADDAMLDDACARIGEFCQSLR